MPVLVGVSFPLAAIAVGMLTAEPLSNTPSAVMPFSAISLLTSPFLSPQAVSTRHSDNASASAKKSNDFFFIDVSFIFVENDTNKRVFTPAYPLF